MLKMLYMSKKIKILQNFCAHYILNFGLKSWIITSFQGRNKKPHFEGKNSSPARNLSNWLVRLRVFLLSRTATYNKSFHYYSPKKPFGKPKGFFGAITWKRLCRFHVEGLRPAAHALTGTLAGRAVCFRRTCRRKHDFKFFRRSGGETLRGQFVSSPGMPGGGRFRF